MTDLDLLHFEQLKKDIQAQYLKEHTPSYDDISKWKGIDIVYFQEDLRKKAKSNISEKSFYTYFKNSPVTKLPRIDILNLLSIYAGYDSWYEFKKQHLFEGELLQDEQNLNEEDIKDIKELEKTDSNTSNAPENDFYSKYSKKIEFAPLQNNYLQKTTTENQNTTKKLTHIEKTQSFNSTPEKKNYQKTSWIVITSTFTILLGLLGFKDKLFSKKYKYCFTDADRGTNVINTLEIKVIKENESPILYKIKPGDCFVYSTKDKNLKMQITSPFYEHLEVNRNLENAPEKETIELKPDDYKMAAYYFSVKDVTGAPKKEQMNLIKQKRNQLENLISNKAIIYQVYDNQTYGIERLDKQKYITLVTTPTTSLKNLSVIEMKKDTKGKIISIKFKIATTDEASK